MEIDRDSIQQFKVCPNDTSRFNKKLTINSSTIESNLEEIKVRLNEAVNSKSDKPAITFYFDTAILVRIVVLCLLVWANSVVRETYYSYESHQIFVNLFHMVSICGYVSWIINETPKCAKEDSNEKN